MSNPLTTKRERIVAGCMTGTSLDGLDAALVRITGTGLDMTADFLGYVSLNIPSDLRNTLLHLANGGAAPPLDYLRAARALGELHADAIESLNGQYLPTKTKLEFAVAHGQTIWHAPPGTSTGESKDDDVGMSWQLFDPWPIVKRIGTRVCYDLRQADLIAGGQGAPLTPISDWVMYHGKGDLIANLGGVFNCTSWSLSQDEGIAGIAGGDVCLCNLLLDGLAMTLLDQPYDKDGAAAAAGVFDETLCRSIGSHFDVKGFDERTSLGRENLQGGVIETLVSTHKDRSPADLLFNAIAFIGQTIGEVFEGTAAQRLVLAGGGTRNKTLVQYIHDTIENDSFCEAVFLSDELGIPCEAREAMGFAVLGALSQDGVPISLSQVTGAKDPGVAGVWAGLGMDD